MLATQQCTCKTSKFSDVKKLGNLCSRARFKTHLSQWVAFLKLDFEVLVYAKFLSWEKFNNRINANQNMGLRCLHGSGRRWAADHGTGGIM